MTQTPPSKRTDLSLQTLKIFWKHALIHWQMVLISITSIVFIVSCDMVLPFLYKRFFDLLATNGAHPTVPGVTYDLYTTLGLIGCALFLSWLGWQSCIIATMKFESSVMKYLLDYSFKYLQNHSYKFFTDNFAGALVKRVNRFSGSFEVVADQLVLDIGQTLLRIVLVVGILCWHSPVIGSVFLLWTILFITFNILFSKWKLNFDLIRAELDTKITARLADTIANAINLKLFAGIDREVHQFQGITEEHRRARYKSWKMGWAFEGFQGFFVIVLELVTLFLAIRYWVMGVLTLGDFILLRSYLLQLTQNVRAIGKNIRNTYQAMADANEMTEVLLQPHDIVDVENATPLCVKKGIVEFRNIQFSYPGSAQLAVSDFNLSIAPCEKIGIVGPSGGGKSTILKLLTRLYDVKEGAILIDGQDISRVSLDSLHLQIAYVPQDPILFHRSLMDNIRYSNPTATDDEVITAATLANCHEFISKFPEQYETLVGERGVKLSGGERQRVAIARAILKNAPILILDEATSSLDSLSERLIQDALSRLIVNRTVIAVAHRLSTIRKMDRIVVVKDGRIVEEGTHNLLVKIENGTYQQLWDLQSNDISLDISDEDSFVN